MRGNKAAFIAAALAAVAAAAFYFRPLSRERLSTDIGTGSTSADADRLNPAASSDATRAAMPSDPSITSSARLLARIDALLEKLEARRATPADLAELKRALRSADPRLAIEAIMQFLASGRDASTAREFAIGSGGELEGAPTLRVMMLDLLGTLARQQRSTEALALSRTILETKTSADEWAISLRNVAWSDPAARPFLAGKMREMLAHEPWRTAPSAGMLEAFDVIVYTQDASFIPTLADLQRGSDLSLQRAAAIALDRLSEAAPLDVMNYLNANPGVMADRPFVRADYFAKADLTQPPQKQALEHYLARTDLSVAEKSKLLQALETPASFVSDNLLTSPPPETDDDARRVALQTAVSEWIKARRFAELAGELQQLALRLAER